MIRDNYPALCVLCWLFIWRLCCPEPKQFNLNVVISCSSSFYWKIDSLRHWNRRISSLEHRVTINLRLEMANSLLETHFIVMLRMRSSNNATETNFVGQETKSRHYFQRSSKMSAPKAYSYETYDCLSDCNVCMQIYCCGPCCIPTIAKKVSWAI